MLFLFIFEFSYMREREMHTIFGVLPVYRHVQTDGGKDPQCTAVLSKLCTLENTDLKDQTAFSTKKQTNSLII